MDLNDKDIPIHQELLGSSNPNPMDSNNVETPVHWEPLGFLAPKPLEQGASFPATREIVALTTK